jgi:hypothetical protein
MNCALIHAIRFDFKGKEPKFRIETPSRVIHVLKTAVSVESSELEKIQIRSGMMRVVKRLGTAPPPRVSAFSQCAVDGFDICY